MVPLHDQDTIAALATPPGRGGVGIIRVSGPLCATIAEAVVGHCPSPRLAHYGPFRGEETVLDEGIALFFPGPHSFTGEDVLELQGHGGPVIMDLLLGRCLELGARPARPGEFSERAFLNDKLDLAQAEAIADLIDASSRAAAENALRSLQGDFSRRVEGLVERLIELRIYVEAAIDFPEEEIDFLGDGRVAEMLAGVKEELAAVRAAAGQGALMREGMSVVIAGRPNAGKSSLLNAIAQRDVAIVTEEAGTTRDVIEVHLDLDGYPLTLIDTAGIREAEGQVEREGIRRALARAADADLVLWLTDPDAHAGHARAAPEVSAPVWTVATKQDLPGAAPAGRGGDGDAPRFRLSALTGEGLADLISNLGAFARDAVGSTSDPVATRDRHRRWIAVARESLTAAISGGRPLELRAEDLRTAADALGRIAGRVGVEDLLDVIFSEFCIGK